MTCQTANCTYTLTTVDKGRTMRGVHIPAFESHALFTHTLFVLDASGAGTNVLEIQKVAPKLG
jgi:hypothetical protein